MRGLNVQSVIMEQIANNFLSTFSEPRIKVKPKTVLLEEGQIADKIFFIHSGCLRLFFHNEGSDITFQFFFENDLVASFSSFYYRQPSSFSLESIENAELSIIGRDDFFKLVEMEPSVKKLYEKTLIERFHTYQQLFLNHIKYTPKQRYDMLLEERPDIIQRVPQHYIASYLGITPVSLSRIRSRR